MCQQALYKSYHKHSNTFIYEVPGVQSICNHALQLEKLFVEKPTTHDNNRMTEIFDSEDWYESTYFSTVGIINKTTATNSQSQTPSFYMKATPGSHRG